MSESPRYPGPLASQFTVFLETSGMKISCGKRRPSCAASASRRRGEAAASTILAEREKDVAVANVLCRLYLCRWNFPSLQKSSTSVW